MEWSDEVLVVVMLCFPLSRVHDGKLGNAIYISGLLSPICTIFEVEGNYLSGFPVPSSFLNITGLDITSTKDIKAFYLFNISAVDYL